MFKKGDKRYAAKDTKKVKETFGLSVKQLKEWRETRIQNELDTEFLKQEIAVSRVRAYLDTIGISTSSHNLFYLTFFFHFQRL
jgi:hypothetical protein